MHLHPNTVKKYSVKRDILDVEGKMETLWEFSGRFSHKDMKLVEVVKGLEDIGVWKPLKEIQT